MTGVKKEESDDKISFMIFRTGSTLIVGKCDKKVLLYVYKYLKKIMTDEYTSIMQVMVGEEKKKKEKKRRGS